MATTVTFKGNPVELSGTPPQVGAQAPAFDLTGGDMSPVQLADSDGKVRILSIVPSIDTGVCSIQTKRFNQEFDSLPDSIVGYTISVDKEGKIAYSQLVPEISQEPDYEEVLAKARELAA